MKPTIEELSRYVDGEVSAARRSQLELLIEQDAELSNTIEALEASRLPIRRAYNNVQYPALPDSLRQQALDWAKLSSGVSRIEKNSKWSGLAVSACMALTLIAGYFFGQSQLKTPTLASTTAADTDFADVQSDSIDHWARVVASYQSLYVRETVEHLKPSTNLSINTPMGNIKIPNFSALGFKFVRSQKLGYRGQPLTQLVYLAANGVPLALCVMPDNADSLALTQFDVDSLNTGFWREAGNRYVLVGDVDNAQLEQLQVITASM